MSDYSRGSEWRKWDLHIHAPSCAQNNQFEGEDIEDKWARYIDKLESLTDIAALGITDYFSVNGYLRVREFQAEGRIENINLILPNVELRILPVTAEQHAINIHVIFDPEVVDELESLFFQSLIFNYEGDDYRCDNDGLTRLGMKYSGDDADFDKAYREGVNQFKVDFNALRGVLRKNKALEGHYIVAVANRSADGASGIQHSSLAATRQEIYRLSHAIFSSNPNDRTFFLGKGTDSPESVIDQFGSLKPCIHGSDAHDLQAICRPTDDRFTWIKSDPTFEGLKQILYEPEARVRLQDENPRHEYPKHYFSSVAITGKPYEGEHLSFADTKLPWNRDMVSIIGGRGTGKSMLLDAVYRIFDKSAPERRLSEFKDIPCSVSLRKGIEEEEQTFTLGVDPEQFEYLHVRQGHVKGLVDRPASLHEEVLRLLGPAQIIPDPVFAEELHKRDEDIERLRHELSLQDEEGNLINSTAYHDNNILQNEALLKTLTTKETHRQIEKFTKNTADMARYESLVRDLTRLNLSLSDFLESQNALIVGINKKVGSDASMHIQPVDFTPQLEQITNLLKYAEIQQRDLNGSNTKIEEELAQKGFKGDIANLLNKADTYRRAIEESRAAIETITGNIQRLDILLEERKQSVRRIVRNIRAERQDIDARFKAKQAGVDHLSAEHKALLQELLKDIEITGTVDLDLGTFVSGLWEFIDGRKFRSTMTKSKDERLLAALGIRKIKDFFWLLAGRSVIHMDEHSEAITLDEFIDIPDVIYWGKLAEFFDYLYLPGKRREYLKVNPKIRYQGKNLNRLSVGQRGTFYLCLKLATESFSTPFIFDQPEDDVDNEFIIAELIPIFREIKKYRQVIIATHNANLVVNADSEQIIIASNDDEILSYSVGSLEYPAIRRRVCDILEGGEEAFLKREQRYGIH